MIELVALEKSYGSLRALRGVNLKVGRGEVFGLLGPNGAGKSTTIRILLGLQRPDAGHALVDTLDPRMSPVEVKRQIGYVPDTPTFHEYLRGREILEFVGEVHGLSRARAAERAAHLLDTMDLREAGDDFAVDYSTGMKKKLALACAVIHEPPVLVLDEPTNALDPATAKQIRDWILAFAAGGKTILMSTHLLDLAERVCSRVGILHHGRILACGTVASLIESHPGRTLEEVFLGLTGTPTEAPA
ncbi:MAG TPA: ABC transporter ATP-binding protein [Polyangia bacterium]